MSKSKVNLIGIVGLVLFVLVMLCACNSKGAQSTNIEVEDLSGRTLHLDKPASKIAALSASDCEVLYAIGAGDKIILRGTFCDYPAEVNSIKDVGSGELTNIEELVATKPDVVVMSKTGFTLDQVNTMENSGLKTFVNQPDTFEDTYKYIEKLGEITGCLDNAKKLTEDMKKSVSELHEKALTNNSEPKKTVYFQLCLPEHGYWTAGKNTFMNEMSDILNVKNVFDDVQGWAEVSKEDIIARNPDFTIVIDNDESFTRPGPRLIDALNSMYKTIYEN